MKLKEETEIETESETETVPLSWTEERPCSDVPSHTVVWYTRQGC